MIYDSLTKIPIVIFFEIAETGNLKLLTDEEIADDVLLEIWTKLLKEHESKQKSKESDKLQKIHNEISALECEYEFVLGAIYCLGFEFDQELIDRLKKLRYIVRTDSTENYYQDLEFIQRASSGFGTKINTLRSMLPKQDENKQSGEKFSIYDTIASYTRILGPDFNYNEMTYYKFYAIQKQVHIKIESEIKNANKK